MANPNIVGVTSILGKISGKNVTTDINEGVMVTAASNTIVKVNSLTVANVDGVNAADITVDVVVNGSSYKLANTITVPADATLVVISKETAIYLEEGDSLRCQSPDGINNLHAVCSYEIIS